MHEMIDKKNEFVETLALLCKKNGRCFEILSDSRIVTFDMYEGTDAHYSDSIEEAIEWEKGYTLSSDAPEINMEQ